MVTFFQSRTGLVLLAFLVIASFYLITEHTAHTFGALPFVLLLLCPLLHLFMHGGHGSHGGHDGHDGPRAPGGYSGTEEQPSRSPASTPYDNVKHTAPAGDGGYTYESDDTIGRRSEENMNVDGRRGGVS